MRVVELALARHAVRNVQGSARLEEDGADFVPVAGIVEDGDGAALDLKAGQAAHVGFARVDDVRNRAALEGEALRAPDRFGDFRETRPEVEAVAAAAEVHLAGDLRAVADGQRVAAVPEIQTAGDFRRFADDHRVAAIAEAHVVRDFRAVADCRLVVAVP